MIMISIIIPVYRVETYLSQCIDSVLSQSFTDFELILIDDGSPDNSGEICDVYARKDERIKVIHQDNCGVSMARNHGLRIARGEWVTFIDSDDWVEESFLHDFYLQENGLADVVCQGLKYINHATGKIKRKRQFDEEIIQQPDVEGKISQQDILSFGVTVCKCFKKRVIDQNHLRFDTSISYHEDHLFTLSFMSHASRIVTVSACGYNYRCGHNLESLSKKRHPYQNQTKACNRMMEQLNQITNHYQISESYYRKIATFCLSAKFNAVSTLFFEKKGFFETKRELKNIMSPLNEFVNFYYPTDKKYGILRILARDSSCILLYIFWWLYTRISKA